MGGPGLSGLDDGEKTKVARCFVFVDLFIFKLKQ